MNVIIVDDDQYSIAILMDLLAGSSVKVVAKANDGLDAYCQYIEKKNTIDVIITDWEMPYCDGIQLTKRVVQEAKESEVNKPGILLTTGGHLTEHMMHKMRKYGIDQFLCKPYSRKELIEKLILLDNKDNKPK